MPTGPRPRLPLFPLPDVVHFPRTELRLHVFEPRYRRLLRDLERREEQMRWIGMVLLRPEPELGFGQPPRIFPEGTAGLLVDVEPLPDGRSNILLQGEFRFTVEREIEELEVPYRQAVVRPLQEVRVNEEDAGVLAVRRDLLEVAEVLTRETGRRFPFEREALRALASQASFEVLVNTLAAELDLPALRKLDLLEQALPERALEVVRILRSRERVVDLLRPYRHLAGGADSN
jgi:hypothetical protein